MSNIARVRSVHTLLSHTRRQNLTFLINFRLEVILILLQLILLNESCSSLSLFHGLIVHNVISIFIYLSMLNNLHWIHLFVSSLTIEHLFLVVDKLLSLDTHILEFLVEHQGLPVV